MTKKGKIILFSVVGALTITLCVGLGVFLANHVFVNNNVPEVEKTIEDYEVNYNEVYNSFISLKQTKTNDEIFSSSKPSEIVNYSLSNLKVNAHYYEIHTTGSSKASIADQTISNVFRKDNDKYYQHSISTGLINTAKCFTMENDIVSIYNGEILSPEQADFSGEPIQALTKKEFRDTWGIDYSFPTIFIISSETVLKENISKKESNHIIELELEPTISTLKYVKQQKNMGDLDADPVFKEVKLTFEINNDFQIIKVSSHEVSNVKRLIWVQNTTDVEDTYQYN